MTDYAMHGKAVIADVFVGDTTKGKGAIAGQIVAEPGKEVAFVGDIPQRFVDYARKVKTYDSAADEWVGIEAGERWLRMAARSELDSMFIWVTVRGEQA